MVSQKQARNETRGFAKRILGMYQCNEIEFSRPELEQGFCGICMLPKMLRHRPRYGHWESGLYAGERQYATGDVVTSEMRRTLDSMVRSIYTLRVYVFRYKPVEETTLKQWRVPGGQVRRKLDASTLGSNRIFYCRIQTFCETSDASVGVVRLREERGRRRRDRGRCS